jgi:hypothetical protein
MDRHGAKKCDFSLVFLGKNVLLQSEYRKHDEFQRILVVALLTTQKVVSGQLFPVR